ncbi:MAG TPA: hypothetical protein VHJ83_03075 [Micromonosporaceae bacterium]|jgi:hypothetical protein|nr:hypothetical protein [Micromonosporaceae bacterium]
MRNVEPVAKPSRRLSAPVISTITVVLLVGVGLLVWWPDSPDRIGDAAPDGLVVRAGQREDLTHLSEGGHQPAHLLYRGCQDVGCDWRVVFRDGRQYLLHHVANESVAEELTGLSPNGRIVAVPTDAGMVFRDLVAGTIQPAGPLAAYQGGDNRTRRSWSYDGRWLVHYNSTGVGIMVDTVTARAHRLPKSLGDITIAGVMGDGRLITVAPHTSSSRDIQVSVSAVADVDHANYRIVDLSGVIRPREALTTGRDSEVESYTSPDGTRLVVAVRQAGDEPGTPIVAVLVIDLASGTVVKRHDLEPATTAVCGWDATGVQVATEQSATAHTVVIRWLDPRTGVERDRVTVRGGTRPLSVHC